MILTATKLVVIGFSLAVATFLACATLALYRDADAVYVERPAQSFLLAQAAGYTVNKNMFKERRFFGRKTLRAGVCPRSFLALINNNIDLSDNYPVLIEEGAGFPFICAKSYWRASKSSVVGYGWMAFAKRATPPLEWEKIDGIPYLPIWTGALLNVGCWSLIAAAVYAGLWRIRLHCRLSQRRCISCGYARTKVVSGAACPECGRLD